MQSEIYKILLPRAYVTLAYVTLADWGYPV
jgi:hypothetical protein